MKKIFLFSILASSIAMITGCDKETEITAPSENVNSSQAQLKINFVSAYTANPSVQLKLNDTRVSNLITARTPFPGGGYNTGGGSTGDYLAVNPGTVGLTIAIPNKNTSNDSVVLFKSNLNLEAGKNYTVHVTDTAANTKMLLTEDDVSFAQNGQVRYRFINLMPNVPAVDLYYGNTLVAANVQYLKSSPYFTMLVPATSLTWSVRQAGADPSSTALATYLSANTSINGRAYTAMATGYKGATDAVRKPFISFYLNK
jgi:hypothetical protein